MTEIAIPGVTPSYAEKIANQLMIYGAEQDYLFEILAPKKEISYSGWCLKSNTLGNSKMPPHYPG